jgi:hypothetical protein
MIPKERSSIINIAVINAFTYKNRTSLVYASDQGLKEKKLLESKAARLVVAQDALLKINL